MGFSGGFALPFGGSPVVLAANAWWGGWFPRGLGLSWWGYPEMAWFPDGPAVETQPGAGPPGAATFTLLEEGAQLTWSWATGVHKSYDGKERRSNLVDDPTMSFVGEALLSVADTRALRSRLARFAAAGLPFLLGLSYEALTITADSTGTTVNVTTTTMADWVVVGARFAVRHPTFGTIEGVVQSWTSNTIVSDVALGDAGKVGAMIMPLMPVFLEPTQAFGRYPVNLERWQLKARNALPVMASAPIKAQLALEAPLTASGMLDGLRLVALEAGAVGNLITVTQTDDALTSGGELDEDPIARTIHIKYAGDDTIVDEYVALLAGSTLVRLLGTYNGTDVLAAGDDEFTATALSGGVDATPITVGIGATVTFFNGRAVWDRGIDVKGTAPDSMQAMNATVDFGGVPFGDGSAAAPDWGRSISIERLRGPEFQWFKLFVHYIKGSVKTFFLPTYRKDFTWIATGTGTITVDDDCDVSAWWPGTERCIQVLQAGNVITNALITGVVDNGNGTITISLIDEAASPITLSGATVTRISWLEQVRLDKDVVPVTFKDGKFSSTLTARVVQQEDGP